MREAWASSLILQSQLREPLSESVEEHREKTKKIPKKKNSTPHSAQNCFLTRIHRVQRGVLTAKEAMALCAWAFKAYNAIY